MEQTYTTYRNVSRRQTRPVPVARVIAIVLVTVAGWTLIHRVGTPAAAQHNQAPPPLHTRAATSVLVLNGNGIAGAAGDLADRLVSHGYRSALATDAQVTTYARSVVLYGPGWENEAERLAKDAQIRAVAPLDGALPAGYSRFPLVAILGR